MPSFWGRCLAGCGLLGWHERCACPHVVQHLLLLDDVVPTLLKNRGNEETYTVYVEGVGNAAEAFQSSLSSFLGDKSKDTGAADTWWHDVRFRAHPLGPPEDSAGYDSSDEADVVDGGGDPCPAGHDDAPADGNILRGLAKALIGKMMDSTFFREHFLRHLGPWEGRELRVGTYCSGSDLAVKALEAVSAVLKTDHHINIMFKHVLSVESDPARRRFILSASPEVNVLLGDITEFTTDKKLFHNYATGEDWR